jgi:hypothetical protein
MVNSSSSSNATNGTIGTNGTANTTTISSIWSSIDLPWGQWKNETLDTIGDIANWLGRYQQYLSVATQYTNQAGIDSVLNVVEQGLANVDSQLNFTNVTYGELVTDYNTIYTSFVGWYNQFFGPNGIVNGEQSTVQDGQTTVYEWSVQVPAFNVSDVLAVEQPALFALPAQFESIAEWITTKFSGIILENACNICNGQSVPIVVPSGNSSNSTNTTSPANSTSNSTSPANETNSTLPVVGGSPNSTNASSPVNSTTNSSGAGFFSSANYSIPENCTLLNNSEGVSCSNGNDSGEFTFAAINAFWNNSISALAAKLENVDSSCNNLTDINACYEN